MKKLSIIIGMLLAFGVSDSLAQFDNIGTSAANFLKIGVGSRGEAMAGAYVAQVQDVTSLFWNVSGLAKMERPQLAVARTDWILDINHVFVGVGLPMGDKGSIGVSVVSLTMGDMEMTTAEQPDGTGVMFGASNFSIGIAYARSLTDRFSVGIQGKYIRESISSASANAFALDVGTQYTTGFRGLTIGMSISNFGTNMRLEGREQLVRVDVDPSLGANPDVTPARLETESWPLPLMFRIGVSMDVLNSGDNRVTTNVDYIDPRDVNPVTAFGVEYSFKEMFYLRAGYRSLLSATPLFTNTKLEDNESDPEQSFYTFGGGVNLKLPGTGYALRLDYAYSDLGRLTQAHRFTFSFDF